MSYPARAEGLVNMIKTNHTNAKIYNTQKNSKYKLSSDGEEIFIYISKWSKLTKKENETKHNYIMTSIKFLFYIYDQSSLEIARS